MTSIHVRLPDDIHRMLQAAADAMGLSVATAARVLICKDFIQDWPRGRMAEEAKLRFVDDNSAAPPPV